MNATTRVPALLLILLCSAGTAWRQEPSPAAQKIKIPAGTPVEIELRTTLSTKTATAGNAVEFVVTQPVTVDGITLIQPCTSVRGIVSEAEAAKAFGASGKLVLSLEGAGAVDGSRVPLRFGEAMHAGRAGNLPRAGVVSLDDPYLVVALFPLAIALASPKGEHAGFPAGERFEVYVESPAEVMIPTTPGAAVPNVASQPPCPSAESAPAAGPPAPSAVEGRYHLVKESNSRKMQEALNSAARSGYRLQIGRASCRERV